MTNGCAILELAKMTTDPVGYLATHFVGLSCYSNQMNQIDTIR